MPGLLTPKGGDTKTSTQTSTPSASASALQQYTLGGAANVLAPYLMSNSYTTAPINSDQSGAYDLTRLFASNAFDPTKAITAPQVSGTRANSMSYAPASVGNAVGYAPASMGAAATYAPASVGNAAQMNAAQVGGGDIQALLNPYLESVGNATMNSMRKAYAQNSAGIGARAAASGSFGGSQEVIERSQANKDYGDQVASTIAQLQSAGYDKAMSTALANAQMRQQADATNTAARNQFTMTDANALNTAAQFNSSAQDTQKRFDAGALTAAAQYGAQSQNANRTQDANALTQAGATNAAAQNARDQFLASLGLQTSQMQDSLKTSDMGRQLQAIQALLGIGNAQQSYYQNNLNVPLQYLQLMGQLTPSNYGSTTTGVTPNTAASPLQTILGAGLTIGSKFI